MVLELPQHRDPIRPLLLDEPHDTDDVRDIRHWIRVYAHLLELTADLPPQDARSWALRQRLTDWQERLDFWQGRARTSTNPGKQ